MQILASAAEIFSSRGLNLHQFQYFLSEIDVDYGDMCHTEIRCLNLVTASKCSEIEAKKIEQIELHEAQY